jgi:maltooligosyltrehalose trehalohydrolase
MKRRHDMPFGPQALPEGGARFRLWAPAARQVECLLDGQRLAMQATADGWYGVDAPQAVPGARYAFCIDGGLTVPDPASRSNPDDVHGSSELLDPEAFDWPDGGWGGRPWHEAVIYELHVGCFTLIGSFDAAIAQLDDLVSLGVTAIELMPVADFPGQRGWGYDGVLLFAPDASYGPPEDLKRLVAAAHERGLMVLLDVVYNHFGPDGNYLHAYAPAFFNPEVHTPWGAAINFDRDGSQTVRDFFIHNALYWLNEFHFDGLRIDAVHAMHDRSALPFIDELTLRVQQGPGRDRHVHIVLENDRNDADRLPRGADGRPRRATAQWNDDVHHTVHVLATGETDGYYADFAARPLALLGRALAEGFAYQGQLSAYRGGVPHGTPSSHLPPLAFVNALQTHDQVGNRAFGERIAQLASASQREDRLRALLACVLLSPSPPMLFMGEEFAASSPFLYFCDFEGDLARAVTEGRRNEFGRFERFADPAVRSRIPDPNDAATFALSHLHWNERTRPGHADWLALYTHLLESRRRHLVPLLPQLRSGQHQVSADGRLDVRWPLADGGSWQLRAWLSAEPAVLAVPPLPGTMIHSHSAAGGQGDDTQAPRPWSVQVSWLQA